MRDIIFKSILTLKPNFRHLNVLFIIYICLCSDYIALYILYQVNDQTSCK